MVVIGSSDGGEDGGQQFVGARWWGGVADPDRFPDGLLRLLRDRGELVLGECSGVGDLGQEGGDRVLLPPFRDLLAGAVEVLVALGVTLPPVGDRLDEGGSAAAAGPREGLGRASYTACTSLPSTLTPAMP